MMVMNDKHSESTQIYMNMPEHGKTLMLYCVENKAQYKWKYPNGAQWQNKAHLNGAQRKKKAQHSRSSQMM